MRSKVLVRISTVSNSLEGLLKGQLRYLNNYFEVIGISSGSSALENVRDKEGIKVVEIPMKRPPDLFNDLLSLIKLLWTLKRIKPHIVHSITPKAGLLAMLTSWFLRVPFRIHTFTGLLYPTATGMKRMILILFDKCICYFSTHIVAESKGVRLELMKITKRHISIIGDGHVNGVNTDLFDPDLDDLKYGSEVLRSELGISKDDIVFLFLGRLVNDKGVRELVEAFQRVSATCNHIHLLVVGGRENEHDGISNELFEVILEHPKIHYFGVCSDVRVYHVLSDYLVLPSYREGFPNVVLQSLSVGVPCIVTNVFGANEVICDNVNGFIIEKKSVVSITNVMMAIANGEIQIKRNLDFRSIIQTKYRNVIVWRNIKEYYDDLNT
jgi:glycosyltransferase involved in cell wall biosynthesis